MIIYRISKQEYLVDNCGILYCGVIGQTQAVYGFGHINQALSETLSPGFPISIDTLVSEYEYEEQNL